MKIEMIIECPKCYGTGVYTGVGEGEGTAIVCYECKGTGAYTYKYEYKEFTGRKTTDKVERVYLAGYGYKIGLGVAKYSNLGPIDMGKEGVSYNDFLFGEMPKHIETMACPLLADQGTCQKIKGFIDTCDRFNGGWVGHIPSCKLQNKKAECWRRFKDGLE